MKKRRLARFVAALAAAVTVVTLAGCTSGTHAVDQPTQAPGSLDSSITKQLDAALADAVKRSGASGAIAGVWAPWAGSWTTAIGTTTTGGSTKMTTSMRFRIASNTRSMTCTVLLALVDKGAVKLDDLVSEYLPRIVGLGSITLGQLCRNTAGLGNYQTSLGSEFVNNPTRQWIPLELVSDGLAEKSTGTPGSTFAYSNTGYILLGMALSAATGQDWPSLYRQYVWQPLGLQGTSLPSSDQLSLPSPSPHGYATAIDNTGALQCGTTLDETKLSPSMGWTAAGAVSTLSDLGTYARALASGSLLSSSSAKEMWQTHPFSTTAPSWEGYGMGVYTLGPLRGHDGAIPGFLSTMLSDPKSGLTVVVMLNNSTVGAGYAQLLGMEFASIASKAAAKTGKAPVIALPWSQKQMQEGMAANTICPPKGVTPTPLPDGVQLPQSGE